MLTLDPEALVCRYLIAEDNDVALATKRLRETIAWRREWRVLEYHEPGAAQRLYPEAINPGSEMYFADSGRKDRKGQPFMVGRLRLANAENMHSWRHLRAGIFAVEMLAIEVIRGGLGYSSYILDIGPVEEIGHFSCTGGGNRDLKESRNPYYKAGAGREASPECLARFGELNTGMSITKAAMHIGSKYYPEMLGRVVFLRSNLLFSLAFKVFKMWAHKRSRDKFEFVGGTLDPPLQKLQEFYSPEALPEEFGGTGWRLAGDTFLREAVERSSGPAGAAQPAREQRPPPDAAPSEVPGRDRRGSSGSAEVGCWPFASCLQPRQRREEVPKDATPRCQLFRPPPAMEGIGATMEQRATERTTSQRFRAAGSAPDALQGKVGIPCHLAKGKDPVQIEVWRRGSTMMLLLAFVAVVMRLLRLWLPPLA